MHCVFPYSYLSSAHCLIFQRLRYFQMERDKFCQYQNDCEMLGEAASLPRPTDQETSHSPVLYFRGVCTKSEILLCHLCRI